MSELERDQIAQRLSNDEEVDQAFKRAVHDAISQSEQRGHRVAIWRDGRPVWVFPTEDARKDLL